MKKLFAMFLALILLQVFICSAVADGVIAPLVESAQTLLFDTENVTLTGHADFFLNGERFKTADILYKQAAENSHWQLDLKTPRKYRKDQETGFTVIANDEKIYVMEKYYPGTYTTGSDAPNNTLIRQSTHADLLFSMLLSVADRIEALLPEDAVSVTRTDTYSEFCFTLSKDTTPAVMNTALNLTADFFLRRFMNVNYDSIGNWGQGLLEDYITVTEGILYSTDSFVLGDTSVTVTENADGCITGASGTVTVLLCSEELQMAPLEIVFDLKVSDYGSTEVKQFSPEDFSVAPRGSVMDSRKETDSVLAQKLTGRAEKLLTAAGYDPASLTAAVVSQRAGIVYVNFPVSEYASVAVGMNENGDLLSLSDGSVEYYTVWPRNPEEDTLPPATADTLNAFLKTAFPDLALSVKGYILDLEYDYDGVTYQRISAVDENAADTGIVFLVQPEPVLKVIYYTCLDQ